MKGGGSIGATLALLVLFAGAARADTETWDFDLQTSGEDVFWTSPTAVCNVAPEYDAAYEITLVEVTVSYLGIPFGPFDVTDQIPPELRSGSGTFEGPPPFVVMDAHIRFPDPPEPVTLEADVRIEVDADGYGHASATNITLGTAVIDLGWPWGEVEVQIETVHVAGTVWVTPVIPGDAGELRHRRRTLGGRRPRRRWRRRFVGSRDPTFQLRAQLLDLG